MASLDMRSYCGKRIRLLRNGDKYWLKNFVVNPRTRTMDSFMNEVTPVVRMPVRKVFTPNHGNRVTNLGQLQSNSSYVVAGGEAFKNIRYNEVREPVAPRLLPAKGPEILVPARHGPYRNVPGRARDYADSKPQGMLTIRVFCNGVMMPSRKVRFPRHLNMNQVLECVNEKVCSVIGAVFYLFRVDGLKISQPSQLENKEYYVAVGREGRFKRNVLYTDNVDAAQITPRRASTKTSPKKAQPFNRFGAVSKRTRKKKSITVESVEPVETLRAESKRFSGSEESLTSDRGAVGRIQGLDEHLINEETSVLGGTGVPLDDILNRRRESVGEESLHHPTSGDFADDSEENQRKSSIYEASGELQENAAEIQDDKETREDKPIDQMPAEEITEEDIEDSGPREQEESQKTRLKQDRNEFL